MKYFILTIILLIGPVSCLYSQENERIVKITVSGSGKTKEDAKQNALRSAIEQAFGTFVSSNTQILNDQIISEQISSVSFGNIKSFEIIDESNFSNDNFYVTLNALVSINNLIKFSESKGVETSTNGNIFSFNIKNKLLNEASELLIITNLFGQLHNVLQNSMDFKLEVKEPTNANISDASKTNWNIPFEVDVRSNSNMNNIYNIVLKTLSALTLNDNEVIEFQKLKIPFYPILISNSKINHTYYLRNENSHKLFMILKNQWRFYCKNFSIKYNDKSVIGQYIPHPEVNNLNAYQETIYSKNIAPNSYSINGNDLNYSDYGTNNDFKHDVIDMNKTREEFYTIKKFTFEPENSLLMKINFNLNMNIEEVEKIDKFKIESNKVSIHFENGIIKNYLPDSDENSKWGIAPFDETPENLNKIKFGGFDDWKIPTQNQLNLLSFYASLGIGGFGNSIKYSFKQFNYPPGFINQFPSLYHFEGESFHDDSLHFLFLTFPYRGYVDRLNSKLLSPFDSYFSFEKYWNLKNNNLYGLYSTRSIRKYK